MKVKDLIIELMNRADMDDEIGIHSEEWMEDFDVSDIKITSDGQGILYRSSVYLGES